MQPVLVSGTDAAAVRIENLRPEGDVGGHLDRHGSVGLDRRVAEDLPHELGLAPAERRAVQIHQVVVRHGHRLHQPQKARRPVGVRRQRRVRQGHQVGGGGAVDVVDALDVEHADGLRHQIRVQLDAGRLVEDDRRSHLRLEDHHLAVHHALLADDDGLLGVLHRIVHPDAVQRVGLDEVGILQILVGARGVDRRRRVRDLVHQPALAPGHQQPVRAVEQRRHEGVPALHHRLILVEAQLARDQQFLRVGEQPLIGEGRLVVLDERVGVDRDGHRSEPGLVAGGPQHHHQAPVRQLLGLHELHGLAVRSGVVAVHAVEKLEVGAVRVGAVEADAVDVGHVVPAAEHHPAVVQHGRVEVRALIEGDLVKVGAVLVDDVERERFVVSILVEGGELRLALVEQDRLGPPLPGGGKHDPAVRQKARCHVLTVLGRDVGLDHPPQLVQLQVVDPDVPGRLIVLVEVGVFGRTHREHQPGAVETGRQILDVVERRIAVVVVGKDPGGDGYRSGARGGAIAQEQFRARPEVGGLTHVGGDQLAVVVDQQRPLDVGHGEIEHHRIGVLISTEQPAAPAGRRAATAGGEQQRRRRGGAESAKTFH